MEKVSAKPWHIRLRAVLAWQSREREPGKIWFTSIRKFKGLEAQAVLIVDFRFSETDSELARRIFYVGCSRANAYLQAALHKDTEEIGDADFLTKLGIL